jgi:hypothetical protein
MSVKRQKNWYCSYFQREMAGWELPVLVLEIRRRLVRDVWLESNCHFVHPWWNVSSNERSEYVREKWKQVKNFLDICQSFFVIPQDSGDFFTQSLSSFLCSRLWPISAEKKDVKKCDQNIQDKKSCKWSMISPLAFDKIAVNVPD